MAELDTRFNIDPARLNPSHDYSDLLFKGFAGIGDSYQGQVNRNRDYAATLQQLKDTRDIAAQESEWRKLNAEREQRNWDTTFAFNTRKQDWDEAHPTATSPAFWLPDTSPGAEPGQLKPAPMGPYDERTIAAQAKARARTPGTKILPKPLQDDLTSNGQDLGNIHRIYVNWKDEYGGHTATGELTSQLGRAGIWGGNPDQADWWADYRANIAAIKRNRLYGAALTPQEQAEFDRNDINPTMDPALVKKNLARQQDILRIGATKKSAGLISDGAKPNSIEYYLGVNLEDLGYKVKRDDKGQITEITEYPAIEGANFGSGGYSAAGDDSIGLGVIQPSQ